MMSGRISSFLDHTAFEVADIRWYIDFFDNVFGLSVREWEGDKEIPSQAWLHGGIQLIQTPEGAGKLEGGRLRHLGLMVEDLDQVLDKVYTYEARQLPQGRNWVQLPDGLCIEIMQAKPGAIDAYCRVLAERQ